MLNERLAKAVKDEKFLRRFWAKVDVRGPDECWPWNASRHLFGYGYFNTGGHGTEYAHRIAYTIAHGPIPDGLFVLHSCDHGWCVNERHMRSGTPAENMHDMDDRGRRVNAQTQGERCGKSKITLADASEIVRRLALRQPTKTVAAELGLSWHIVCHIHQGRTWPEVERPVWMRQVQPALSKRSSH